MKEKIWTIKKTELKKTIESLIEKGSKKFPWKDFSFRVGKKEIDYYWDNGNLYLIWDWGNNYHVASFVFENSIWKNWNLIRKMKMTYLNQSFVK